MKTEVFVETWLFLNLVSDVKLYLPPQVYYFYVSQIIGHV